MVYSKKNRPGHWWSWWWSGHSYLRYDTSLALTWWRSRGVTLAVTFSRYRTRYYSTLLCLRLYVFCTCFVCIVYFCCNLIRCDRFLSIGKLRITQIKYVSTYFIKAISFCPLLRLCLSAQNGLEYISIVEFFLIVFLNRMTFELVQTKVIWI